MYMVTVELDDRDPAAELTDHLFAVLDHLRPAVALSPRGWLTVIVRVGATSARQAILVGGSAVEQATGREVVHLSATVAAEFEARFEWSTYNPVVSETEAARLLGVDAAVVEQRVHQGQLRGTKVGDGYAISRAAVTAAIESR
jgi:excisionase family DNA binding protein